MTDRLKTAEGLVRKLTPEELVQFTTWFAEFQSGIWEKQIENDSNSGRLDGLIEKANRGIDAGQATNL